MKPDNYSGMSVVIVNWQRPKETIECIQSILKAGVPVDRVLVVNNGFKDDSIAQIKSNFPEVQLYSLAENLGFAVGYNHGIQRALEAGAEKLFVLNHDTVINEQTIPTLLESGWDVVVPKIYYHGDPNRIWSAGAYWRRFPPMVVMRGYKHLDDGQYDQPERLEYATAYALLVR